MYFKLLLVLFICLFNCITCENDFINNIFIEKSRGREYSNYIYHLNSVNRLNLIDRLYEYRDPYTIDISIPLQNPKILGSFSSDYLFIFGRREIEPEQRYQANDFKKIYVVDNETLRDHHSITNYNDLISIISMTIDKNNYFSISIHSFNSSILYNDNNNNSSINDNENYFNYNDVIVNLNNLNNTVYSSNIKINSNDIKYFKYTHEKKDNLYSVVIKEKDTNDIWLITFDIKSNSFTNIQIIPNEIKDLKFETFVFGLNVNGYAKFYGYEPINGSRIIMSWQTTLSHMYVNKNDTYRIKSLHRINSENSQYLSIFSPDLRDSSKGYITKCFFDGEYDCDEYIIKLYDSNDDNALYYTTTDMYFTTDYKVKHNTIYNKESNTFNDIFNYGEHNDENDNDIDNDNYDQYEDGYNNTIFLVSLLVPLLVGLAIISAIIFLVVYLYKRNKRNKQNQNNNNNNSNNNNNNINKDEDKTIKKDTQFEGADIDNI